AGSLALPPGDKSATLCRIVCLQQKICCRRISVYLQNAQVSFLQVLNSIARASICPSLDYLSPKKYQPFYSAAQCFALAEVIMPLCRVVLRPLCSW
ncbi:MAG: hypothetical protein IJU76_01485, partial [Desulfovibrionaceae bacterium]|nr:hypothetical protein [Desulfovibrionaceae bacterium]